MQNTKLIVKGAREHNLKNVDIEIPRDKLIVFTGISGSGKSSLAFDTIYAEGARRYVESLSSYARQFLGQMDKPDVDFIEGLSPAISIDQKTTSKNPRSTVGTVTEISDYLRLLYANIGIPHCPVCGREIKQQTVDQIVDQILSLEEGTRIQLLAPVVRGRKGEHVKEFEAARKSGYVRVRVDGNLYDLSEAITLEKNKKHTIEIVVDRLVVQPDIKGRLADSIETATSLTGRSADRGCRWRRGTDLFAELFLPGAWGQCGRIVSPHVLLQQPVWRLSQVHGFGDVHVHGIRIGSLPIESSPFGRGPSMPAAGIMWMAAPSRRCTTRDWPPITTSHWIRPSRICRRKSSISPLWDQGGENQAGQTKGIRTRRILHGIRGRSQQFAAPLQRNHQRLDAGRAGSLYERGALSGMSRRAVAQGEPGGDGRGDQHLRAVL